MRAKRGFTLIELLVVILIIGITSSVVLLAFGDFGKNRQIRLSAEQFIAYIKLVQQRALLEATSYGLVIAKNGYQTWRFTVAQTWQPLPENGLFHKRFFPKNSVTNLYGKKKIKSALNSPDVIINSSGELTAFKLTLGPVSEPQLVTVIGHDNGDLVINGS